jgi:short-subunit dehydrogenase
MTMAKRTLTGARILITGASQGIGRALALAAARKGARLILVARKQELLNELGDELKRMQAVYELVSADVTQSADRERMLKSAVDRFGGLDILVNNAGVGATGHFCEANEDRLRQIFEVNFFALAETTRAAIPLLQDGKTPMIVNIGSVVGKRGLPARSEYSASKFAVQGFTEALRAEMARFDIDVLIVNPGLTATNFPKNMIEHRALVSLDHRRTMTPEQVAALTLRAMEQGKSEIVLTFTGKLVALLNRFFPRLVDYFAARRVRALFREERAAKTRKPAAPKRPTEELVGAGH